MTNYMKHFRSIAWTAAAGCLSFALLPSLHADEWNKKTKVTITEPMEVPSCCTPDHTIILQPGEYVFALVDSAGDRNIVRIFDKDQVHVITTILAISNYRLQPTGKTVFQFWEVPAGQPQALRAWFYPGDNFGQEFAYPKQAAVQIAAFVKVPVPAIEMQTVAVEELKTVPVAAVAPPEPVVEAAAAPAPTPVEAPAAAPAPEPAAPATLPQTASDMPLIGLAGLVSLGLFAALGFRPRRLCKA